MYASELMEWARKNPKEYAGKRYKVVNTCVFEPLYDVKVNTFGNLVCGEGEDMVYINTHTQLEEIPPKPKPVTFMEAVNSGKNVKPYGDGECWAFMPPKNWISFMGCSGKLGAEYLEYINGLWLIEP